MPGFGEVEGEPAPAVAGGAGCDGDEGSYSNGMVDDRLRLQVFVASPSDTRQERGSLHGIIEELNLGLADSRGIVLELVQWETHSWPGVGVDPQDVINHQIDVPDIVIGIFWKRLGTETGRAASGSVEEIENALRLRAAGRAIEVLVYFNEETYFPRQEELEQVAGVLRFRDQLAGKGLLTASYQGLEDFKSKVRLHLTNVIRRWPVGRALRATPPQGFRAVGGKVVDDRSSWRSALEAGRLSVRISSPIGGEAYALAAAVTNVMREKGFGTLARERVSIALMEFLANVANHAEGPADVEIRVNSDYFKHVYVSVTSKGRAFDFWRAVRDGISTLNQGEREHGLLRVRMVSGNMYYLNDRKAGTTTVQCEVYDPSRPRSVMDGVPFLAPILQDYSTPRRLWIGPECYTKDAFELLSPDSPRLLETFFGPLAARRATWLGIEYVGRDYNTGDYVSPLAVESAIERYFKPAFDARRVLVLAHRTMHNIANLAETWAAERGLEFFTSEDGLARRITDLESSPDVGTSSEEAGYGDHQDLA